jgi:hypothetical protein
VSLVSALLQLAAGGSAATLNLDPHALDPCAKPSPDEIVVCGSRGRSPYRLPKLSRDFDPKRLHPENVVPGGRIHVQSVQRPDGLVDKRIMITFAIPF